MTYDPFTEDRNDPRESPGTARTETGRSEMVIGVLLLLFTMITMFYVGWDVRAGNMFMQVMFWAGLIGGILLLAIGAFQRSRGKRDLTQND